MSNKMTQGFDEYWDKENVRFDDSYHKHKETYDLGAASRQAEIDSLKIELNGANERAVMTLNHKNKMVDKMQAEIDELQKRLAMYERQGYKLVPKSFIADIHDIALDGKYLRETDQSQEKFTEIHELCKEAMIGAVE